MDKNNSFATKEFEPDVIWTGTPSRIGKSHNTIKVAYHNTDGKLRVYQSPNGHLWDYYDSETDISGNGYKQVGINGNYYYVWYEHLTGTNTITLTTNLSSQIHDQFDVKLTPNDTVTVDGLQFDGSGALIVTGGTGGGGDASSQNQLDSNIALFTQMETQADRLLFDLDIIANRLYEIQGDVEVTNQITGFATSQLQESSNTALWSQLNLIEQGTEINAGYLQAIDTHLTPLQQGVARYDINARTTLSPDTVPAFSVPVSGIPASEGWYYKNTSAGNASQLYYYVNQSSQTRNHDYTISSIQSQWAVVRLLNLNSGTSLPFLVVYSQPQGSGDILPGFARSSWVYQIATGQELRLGEKVIIYRGVQPDSRIYPELRRVECTLTLTRGPALTSELLAYATLNTDSGATVNTVEYVCGGAGVSFLGDHVYKVELTAESSTVSSSDASSSNQVLQLNAATNSNLAVCSRLDTQNLLSNTIVQLLGDTVQVINYGLLNDTPQYVPIKASSSGNLFVYDSAVNSTIASVRDELITLNGTITELADGTKQMYVALSGDDSVSVMGYNATTLMPEAVTLTESSGIRALDVHVANQPSGYATASGQDDLIELIQAQSQYDRFQVEDGQGNTKLDTIITNMSLTNFNVSNLTKCDTDNVAIPAGVAINGSVFVDSLTTCNTNDVYISNYPSVQSVSLGGENLTVSDSTTHTELGNIRTFLDTLVVDIKSPATTGALLVKVDNQLTQPFSVEGTFWQETQPVSISTTVDSNITNTSIDVHGYASSDGTTWHHLKSDPTGHLIVHAEARDGNNNRITSTEEGAKRGLDVNLITSVSVANTDATAIITRPRDVLNTQVATNATVNGPMRIGNSNADTQGYTYISAIMSFTSVTTGGSVFLEVSHDETLWARPTGASTFVNTSMASVTASILLSSPVPFRYARLWADTGLNASSCSAWIVLK